MKRFLLLGAALAVVAAMGPQATSATPASEPAKFPYGVGANDVRPFRANLWTNTPLRRVLVQWSTNPGFSPLAGSDNVAVPAGRAGNLLYRLLHLTPTTTYFYRFADPHDPANTSRVGRFRTAPPTGAQVDVTFTFSGDQDGEVDPETGLPCRNNMESFDAVAAEDSDFYVNLGDTIYSDSECRTAP